MITLFKVWSKTRVRCCHLEKRIGQCLSQNQVTFEILNATLVEILKFLRLADFLNLCGKTLTYQEIALMVISSTKL